MLHVTGDWKWTGPAQPMLELLLAQRARGWTADLVCPDPEPGGSTSLVERATAAGVTPVLRLGRGRGVRPWRDRVDASRLAELVAVRDCDIVHTWHSRDHWLALRALRSRRQRTRLVRSLRSAEAIPRWPWNRWLFGPGTDALLCVSPRSARSNQAIRGGRPLRAAFGAVDLERFAPGSPSARVRAGLGLSASDRVVGIVARVQRSRRFDLLLTAMQRLAERQPDARLLVIGRGTNLDELARIPARELGLADRVCFAGYRGHDYVDVLRAVDVFTLLVPGSDGTCRALLEAAACGLPAVVTRRGALDEIVLDAETGLVVDEDPAALSEAWERLLIDPALRAGMGAAARLRAERTFAPETFAADVAALYADSLGSSA